MTKEKKELAKVRLDAANHHIGYISDYHAFETLRNLLDVVELLINEEEDKVNE